MNPDSAPSDFKRKFNVCSAGRSRAPARPGDLDIAQLHLFREDLIGKARNTCRVQLRGKGAVQLRPLVIEIVHGVDEGRGSYLCSVLPTHMARRANTKGKGCALEVLHFLFAGLGGSGKTSVAVRHSGARTPMQGAQVLTGRMGGSSPDPFSVPAFSSATRVGKPLLPSALDSRMAGSQLGPPFTRENQGLTYPGCDFDAYQSDSEFVHGRSGEYCTL